MPRAGVAPAGYVAFLTAAPVLDPVLFGALVVIVGLEAALLYTAVAFVGAVGVRDDLLTVAPVNWLYDAIHEKAEPTPWDVDVWNIKDWRRKE